VSGVARALRYAVVVPPALLAGASTAATLLDARGALGWLSDLAVHWQWLYLLGCVGGTAIASALDRGTWRTGAACIGICAVCFSQYSAPLPDDRGSGPVLKVVSANVYLGNDDLDPLVAWIACEDPDVVFLQEVSATAMRQLPLSAYPYVVTKRPAERYGVVLMSRHPLSGARAVELDADLEGHRLSWRTTLDWQGRSVAVAAVHLPAPTSARFHDRRNALMRDTAQWTHAQGRPAIVAGDLNATPWSRPLKQAAAEGLRRATGLAPSWPALPDWFGIVSGVIPIDYVLASAHWSVIERRLGPNVGSDHRPVVVALRLTEATD
jgi:endonuclease/exonuclease/phosphatase (EEP) superfamily protein YafD